MNAALQDVFSAGDDSTIHAANYEK